MTNQASNITEAIKEEISNIVIELYDTISLFHENNDLEAVHKYIESYIKRVTRIGLRLGKSNFTALRDSCVIFHEILEALNKKDVALTEKQFQQFEVWPTLILAYLENPADKNNIELILEFLQDPIWSYSENTGDFAQLKQGFLSAIEVTSETIDAVPTTEVEDVKSNDEAESSDDTDYAAGAFDGALFESVQEEILEAMTSLISDLASTDADDDFGLGHAFSLCADRIELLGMSIATAGLMGLMDVCMIFQTGLRSLSQREKRLSDDEQIIIEEWTSHLIAYLSSPTDHDIVDNLVDYLNKMPWSDPMSEDEMMTLRFMLIPEDIVVTAPVQDIEFNDKDLIAKQNINTNRVAEEELVYEMDNADGLDDISLSEDKYDLGHELIQLIHDEFQLEQASLDETIHNLSPHIKISDDNIEQLTTFNSMIERFSLATESIGLTGLNKVLKHLIQNIETIINQKNKNTLSENIVSFLQQFSQLALDYLSGLDNVVIINKLISPFIQQVGLLNLIMMKIHCKKNCARLDLLLRMILKYAQRKQAATIFL